MKLLEGVILNKELEELAKKGIHKDYSGTIAKINGDICTVWFFNPNNRGEFAFAEVNKKHLIPDQIVYPERLLLEMEGFFANVKMENYTHLTECDVKEYDKVELLVEKPKYAFEGVHKGAHGCVLFPYAIEGRWGILFYNVGENNDEEIELNVDRKDFKIIE